MLRNQKGVSIVALIITVILLVILTGVVIKYTLDDRNILDQSQKAVNDYNEKVNELQNQINDLQDMLNEVYNDAPNP